MFFMMGITEGRKDLDFNQIMICSICGKYGNFKVYMTYTVLSLFFIPCFKWNKRYYVKTSCCNMVYELDPEIGKIIAKGESVEIKSDHLTKLGSQEYNTYKRCASCGYETREDFEFCPKCGNRF